MGPSPRRSPATIGYAAAPSSPFTRWTREHWAGTADGMLRAVRGFGSPGHARVALPGGPGGYGGDVDGLEGFARSFLLAGFRLAGERGDDPHGLADWYAKGIATGTDPASPERWVRLDEHAQAKVEAASLALVLDLTRPWLWDRLDPRVQERVVEYLAPAVGDPAYPRINWVWFRLVAQTFLRSVGGPWSADDVAEDLATHDSFLREDAWMSDGPERSFDHYLGWALHLYPVLWARMAGAVDLAGPRRERDVALLDRFLVDALALVGADGSPLLQGRSLTYRFAAAAPFWVGAVAGVPSSPPGLLRRAASGVLQHFVERGALDSRGLLTLGWHGPWPSLAQAYSGPASPYWASKGMLGLALPADHPVWTATELPLPVEQGDFVRAVRAPGWLVSGTADDGVVRVVNHGTDHAREGEANGDSPLYARLGYSTATSPLLDAASWTDPLDQAVVLVDGDGRCTHRTGMHVGPVEVLDTTAGPVAVGSSWGKVHWLDPDDTQQHHGSGWTGAATDAGRLAVLSIVRGPCEVRLARVHAVRAGRPSTGLRIAGWAVSGADVEISTTPYPTATASDGARSRIVPLIGAVQDAGVDTRHGASPLGRASGVPWLRFGATPGAWVAVMVELRRDTPLHGAQPTAVLEQRGSTNWVTTQWPDGEKTQIALPAAVDE